MRSVDARKKFGVQKASGGWRQNFGGGKKFGSTKAPGGAKSL